VVVNERSGVVGWEKGEEKGEEREREVKQRNNKKRKKVAVRSLFQFKGK
jgi:hypothetical protein